MKISRHRRVRKYLSFYKNNFQFRIPYQILIDATFCHEALKCKLNIREQLPKYLEDPKVKLFTTSCVIAEVEMLGPKVFGAMLVTKGFKTRICGHEKAAIGGADCLFSMVANGNPDHYFIATQDRSLNEKCCGLPGIPVLYINYNAINLQKPSIMNEVMADEKTRTNLQNPQHQIASLQKLKEEVLKNDDTPVSKKTKKRKAKGPNPLSCKKKTKVSAPLPEKTTKRKRHKRSKNKSLVASE